MACQWELSLFVYLVSCSDLLTPEYETSLLSLQTWRNWGQVDMSLCFLLIVGLQEGQAIEPRQPGLWSRCHTMYRIPQHHRLSGHRGGFYGGFSMPIFPQEAGCSWQLLINLRWPMIIEEERQQTSIDFIVSSIFVYIFSHILVKYTLSGSWLSWCSVTMSLYFFPSTSRMCRLCWITLCATVWEESPEGNQSQSVRHPD